MTTRDERAPSPTDPPLDAIEAETTPVTGDDTEGHSLLNAEYGRTVARDHVREAERIARDSARVRDARTGKDDGFLKRFARR
jgi:hypothetical protein